MLRAQKGLSPLSHMQKCLTGCDHHTSNKMQLLPINRGSLRGPCQNQASVTGHPNADNTSAQTWRTCQSGAAETPSRVSVLEIERRWCALPNDGGA